MRSSNNPGLTGRGVMAWRGYSGLRRRSRYSSTSWWRYKIIQGLLIGGGLILFGILLSLMGAVLNSGGIRGTGLLFAVLGILILVAFLAAPTWGRWMVSIPENWIYAVEDADGYTVEYLGPGRWIVPFQAGKRVVEHVNFSTIQVDEVMEDILDSRSLPVDLGVSVTLRFNPVEADPDNYATLRRMRTPEPFQNIVARDLRDLIHHYLSAITPTETSRFKLDDLESLETVILDTLDSYAPLGMFPAANRPVSVRMIASRQSKEAQQVLLARAVRMREQAQTIGDIKRMAQELGIPFEDAFQLLYLLQYGAPAQPTSRTRRVPEPPTQPVVILRQVAPGDVDLAPTLTDESKTVTAEHAAVTLADIEAPTQPGGVHIPAPTEPPIRIAPPKPAIQNADQAPNPMDLRRERKAERRSRRVD